MKGLDTMRLRNDVGAEVSVCMEDDSECVDYEGGFCICSGKCEECTG